MMMANEGSKKHTLNKKLNITSGYENRLGEIDILHQIPPGIITPKIYTLNDHNGVEIGAWHKNDLKNTSKSETKQIFGPSQKL